MHTETQHRGNISIHPPRGGWDPHPRNFRYQRPISIHPPRGGWDDIGDIVGTTDIISIHPPRGGWDILDKFDPTGATISIHPPRGGWDHRRPGRSRWSSHFNPPTPWGVGHQLSDFLPCLDIFQSTHPVGGGTGKITRFYRGIRISIHPPRGGWDFSNA